MRPLVWRGCAVAAALWPVVAEAHSPIKGLGTFYNYMLHPLLVPAHALILIAVALLLGQQERGTAGRGLAIFALGFATGLVMSGIGFVAGMSEPLLLAGCVVIGSAVGIGRHPPILGLFALAGGAGILIGLDSAPETTVMQDAVLAYSGLTTGVLYSAAVVSGLTIGLMRNWQRVGIRIVGSWIVAASVLVLALTLTNHVKGRTPVSDLAPGKVRSC